MVCINICINNLIIDAKKSCLTIPIKRIDYIPTHLSFKTKKNMIYNFNSKVIINDGMTNSSAVKQNNKKTSPQNI